MDYPHEILFPGKEMPGAVRLKVAAIAALLDHGSFDHTEFSDVECFPFTGELEYKAADGKSYEVYRKPQTFFSIEPVGQLAVAAKKVMQAMGESVRSSQLQTVVTRFNLNGEVDPINTWVRLGDAADWLQSRNIDTGGLFGELWDDEEKVFEAAATASDAIRLKLETPNVEPEIAKLRAGANWDDVTNEKFMELLRDNIALRDGGRKAVTADLPLKERERDTLLTIIAALCKEAKIPYDKPAKAAGLIKSTAATMGASIGETTIEGHLKKIPDALATRMK